MLGGLFKRVAVNPTAESLQNGCHALLHHTASKSKYVDVFMRCPLFGRPYDETAVAWDRR